MKLFRNESGFALPLALLVMVTTSAILVTAITTTSSTGRTANLGKTAVSAEALAEAGLANGIAILAKPGQNMNNPELFPHTLATAITYTIDGGTAKLWGVYNTATPSGRCTAQGSLPNPTGGAAITKTLSRTTQVLGIAAGATVPEWSRFIYDDASDLLHDRHRHDPRCRRFPGADVPQERRQCRRELDRRRDDGRRRDEPHHRRARRPSAWRTPIHSSGSGWAPSTHPHSTPTWQRPTPTTRPTPSRAATR